MKFPYRLKQLLLVATDLASFYIGFLASLIVRHQELPSAALIERHLPLFTILFLLWIIVNYINSLYDFSYMAATKKNVYRRIAETSALSLVTGVVFFYILSTTTSTIAPKTILLLTLIFGYGISIGLRNLMHAWSGLQKKLQTNILFIGYTQEVEELLPIIKKQFNNTHNIVAIVDPAHDKKPEDLKGIEFYQGLNTIRPAITTHKVNMAIIAPHLAQDTEALRELYELLFWPVQISDLIEFYEHMTGRIPPSTFSESWFLNHLKNTTHPIYNRIRTIIDYLAGLTIGGICLILLPFIGLAIKCTSKGPIFFTQKRIGQNGKIFTLYKFRSMYALAADGSAETNGAQFADKNDTRITAVGKFLRKTRLDEFPQAWNLLKRDITLIGPRPERPEITKELELEMPYYPLRHVVKPGITGWAAIHQHYTNTMETTLEKLQYDLYYIKNRSIMLDSSIILKTINVMLRMKGQ